MKIGVLQAAFLTLALSASARAQTGAACSRYDAEGVRVGMAAREVWNALGGKGDSTVTVDGPQGTVAVVRYTSRAPMVEVEYDRAEIGRNQGTLTALRRRLPDDWVRDPSPFLERFGPPTSGAERLPGGLQDGPVEWIDPACRVTVRLWYEAAAWWDPGNAKTWLEIRRYDGPDLPVVAGEAVAATTTAVAAVAAVAAAPGKAAPDADDGVAPGRGAPSEEPAVDPGATSAIPVAGDGGVSFPVRIPASYVAPVYPRIASLAGLDGVVRVQARIGTSGEVLDIVSVEATPGGRGFEEAATDAIRSWRFTPAVLDGRPVEVLMPLVVEFKHRR